MSFLDLMKMKAAQVRVPMPMPPLVHPKNVPPTGGELPADFHEYKYLEPQIVRMTRDGNPHSRTLFARLVRARGDAMNDGANSRIEMLVPLRDLYRGNHPEAAKAARELSKFYEAASGERKQGILYEHRSSLLESELSAPR